MPEMPHRSRGTRFWRFPFYTYFTLTFFSKKIAFGNTASWRIKKIAERRLLRTAICSLIPICAGDQGFFVISALASAQAGVCAFINGTRFSSVTYSRIVCTVLSPVFKSNVPENCTVWSVTATVR